MTHTNPKCMNAHDIKYSVYIENVDNEPYYKDDWIAADLYTTRNAALTNLQYKPVDKWVRDEGVIHCYRCKIKFGLMTRKHHCRFCGRIFCNSCASDWRNIPETMYRKSGIENLKEALMKRLYKTTAVRVCSKCAYIIDEYEEVSKIFRYLKWLTIRDVLKLLSVSRMWNKAVLYYISILRSLKYKMLYENLTDDEKDVLICNFDYFSGHNRLIIQTSRLFGEIGLIDRLNRVCRENRMINCTNTFCTSACRKKLQGSDIIQMIGHSVPPDRILQTLLENMKDVGSDELFCFVPVFINIISRACINRKIYNFLIERASAECMDSIVLCQTLYWEFLRLQRWDLVEIYEEDILERRPERKEMFDRLKSGYRLCCNLRFVDKKNLIASLKNIFHACGETGEQIAFPGITDQFVSLDYSGVSKKSSKTAPIILPFVFQNSKGKRYVKRMIFKNDEIIKDYIISKIIKLFTLYLKRDKLIDGDVITYDIILLDDRNGLIEMIDDADTIYNIRNRYNMNILNYILENNKYHTINYIRDKFLVSLAAYSVITYLLGIGDRHLDNIMIHKNGSIFHIDFGYILGDDPKFSTATMRISDDMLDTIGGKCGSKYEEFKMKCMDIFNYLRNYAGMVVVMLNLLGDSKCRRKKIINEIKTRFEPGEKYLDAQTHIITIVDNSHDTIGSSISDGLHKISRFFTG